MPESIEIQSGKTASGSIRPPGSKSITNRAFICAAMAKGTTTLHGVLDSDDTQVMIACLGQIGISVTDGTQQATKIVEGCGGRIPHSEAELFVGNSGTTVRFLTAMLAAGNGNFRLDGVPRMRERPIQDLLDALNQLGANASSETGSGCPPVQLSAHGLPGGSVQIRGDISSQYLSGLLMAAPYADENVEIEIVGQLVSQPYVDMTCAVMADFGVQVIRNSDSHITVLNQPRYNGVEYEIEPDASAASYFWAAAAITGGMVTVEGLTKSALQGDVGFCDCLKQMGCEVTHGPSGITVKGRSLHGIDVNMNAISDTVQTLAGVALFADGPTRITGVGHIRHKETDRISDLACELRKLGADVEEWDDGLQITPGELRPASIDTYDDHRMAMSLTLPGLRIPGVVINDPGCTAKTYPNFFQDLDSILSDIAPDRG